MVPSVPESKRMKIEKNRSQKFTRNPMGGMDTAPFIITSMKMGVAVVETGH
jgi:hypothetical protein